MTAISDNNIEQNNLFTYIKSGINCLKSSLESLKVENVDTDLIVKIHEEGSAHKLKAISIFGQHANIEHISLDDALLVDDEKLNNLASEIAQTNPAYLQEVYKSLIMAYLHDKALDNALDNSREHQLFHLNAARETFQTCIDNFSDDQYKGNELLELTAQTINPYATAFINLFNHQNVSLMEVVAIGEISLTQAENIINEHLNP